MRGAFHAAASAALVTLSNGDYISVTIPVITTQNLTQFVGFSSDTPFTSLTVTGVPNAIDVTNFTTGAPGAVPEPAIWALMLMGMGGVGAMLRQRRGVVTAESSR